MGEFTERALLLSVIIAGFAIIALWWVSTMNNHTARMECIRKGANWHYMSCQYPKETSNE